MTKIKSIFFSVLMLIFLSSSLYAQENKSGLEIKEIKFALGVENRNPKDAATSFSKEIKKIYCWTVVASETDNQTIKHIWYKGEQKMFEFILPIKPSANFRTWSSKSILPEWTGNWKVDVTDSTGKVLSTGNFEINDSKTQ